MAFTLSLVLSAVHVVSRTGAEHTWKKTTIFLARESEIQSLKVVNVEESRGIPEENESNSEFPSSAYPISPTPELPMCGTEVNGCAE